MSCLRVSRRFAVAASVRIVVFCLNICRNWRPTSHYRYHSVQYAPGTGAPLESQRKFWPALPSRAHRAMDDIREEVGGGAGLRSISLSWRGVITCRIAPGVIRQISPLNYCVNHFSCICAYSGDTFTLSSAALISYGSASLPLHRNANPFP